MLNSFALIFVLFHQARINLLLVHNSLLLFLQFLLYALLLSNLVFQLFLLPMELLFFRSRFLSLLVTTQNLNFHLFELLQQLLFVILEKLLLLLLLLNLLEQLITIIITEIFIQVDLLLFLLVLLRESLLFFLEFLFDFLNVFSLFDSHNLLDHDSTAVGNDASHPFC